MACHDTEAEKFGRELRSIGLDSPTTLTGDFASFEALGHGEFSIRADEGSALRLLATSVLLDDRQVVFGLERATHEPVVVVLQLHSHGPCAAAIRPGDEPWAAFLARRSIEEAA